MSHDCHDALPGFHQDQVLIDGCRECEERSQRPDRGISNLDRDNFIRAYQRARQWNLRGLATISDAEVPLLSVLWSLHIQMERAGLRGSLFGEVEFAGLPPVERAS